MPRLGRQLTRSMAFGALAAVGFTSLIGCGSNYRPVVSAINPVGPSAQPSKFAVAVSSPSPTLPGLVTIVDYSGDSVLDTTNIGVAPQYLVLGGGGTIGYTLNGDGTLTSFVVSSQLIASEVLETTFLPSPANTVPAISIFPEGTNTYVSEPGRNAIADFQSTTTTAGTTGSGGTTGTTGAAGTTTASTGPSNSPLSLKQEINVLNPIYVVGLAGAPRVYALSQGDGTPAHPPVAIGIDTAGNTPTASLPVGNTPVYGIMTADGKRAFVMNKGSNSVTVINAQTNLLDSFVAASPAGSSTINVGVNPLWADFAPTLSEMVVANAGNGTGNGSLSIVSIPLCNAAAQVSNPNCDATNPVDAQGFGTVLANIPVGINPVMVAALQDGTQAYVANSGNQALPCVDNTGATNGNCSVSVVNLTSNLVTTTIPLSCHPSYIAATTGAPTGKVYVVCPDSKNMTVIRTDINTIALTIPLQGNGVSVRVTAP